MRHLEQLHQQAHDANIDVFYLNLGTNIKAVCGMRNGLRGIALNRALIESAAEEKVILAEEIMHFETGMLYKITENCNTQHEKIKFRKAEAKVKGATIEKLLPLADILKHINKGIVCKYEMAEELDVPTDFLCEAIDYYNRKKRERLNAM